MAGIVELLFVFAVVIGWGIFELRGTRRTPKSEVKPPPTPGDDPTSQP